MPFWKIRGSNFTAVKPGSGEVAATPFGTGAGERKDRIPGGELERRQTREKRRSTCILAREDEEPI